MVKAVTQTAPDVEIGWSRRRHASRQRSGGVRHKSTTFQLNCSLKATNRPSTSNFSLKCRRRPYGQFRKHRRIVTVFGSSDQQLRSIETKFLHFRLIVKNIFNRSNQLTIN